MESFATLNLIICSNFNHIFEEFTTENRKLKLVQHFFFQMSFLIVRS